MSLSLPEINISGKKIEVPVIFISFRNVAQSYCITRILSSHLTSYFHPLAMTALFWGCSKDEYTIFLEMDDDRGAPARSPLSFIDLRAFIVLFIAIISRNLYVTPLTELSARGSTYFSFHAALARAK